MPISVFLPNVGGMEIALHNIASHLVKKGWEPVVIVPFSYARAIKKLKWKLPYRVAAFPPGMFFILKIFPKLSSDFYFSWMQQRYKFDVWHCTTIFPIGCLFARFISRHKKKIPYLVRCVGGDINVINEIDYGFRLRRNVNNIIQSCLPKMQHLIALNKNIVEEYQRLGVDEQRISLVPNGIDLDRFSKKIDRCELREKYGLDKNDFIFVHVARNHPVKNQSLLLEAMAQLKERTTLPFKLLLIGQDVDLFQRKINQLEIKKYVKLFDKIDYSFDKNCVPQFPSDELIELLKISDAFVFPSFSEGFSLSIVEAMAVGLPVIVSDCAGCRDVVDHGRFGEMCSPKDINAWFLAMLRYITDDAHRQYYVERSLERVKSFSWSNVVDRYIDIYKQLINGILNEQVGKAPSLKIFEEKCDS